MPPPTSWAPASRARLGLPHIPSQTKAGGGQPQLGMASKVHPQGSLGESPLFLIPAPPPPEGLAFTPSTGCLSSQTSVLLALPKLRADGSGDEAEVGKPHTWDDTLARWAITYGQIIHATCSAQQLAQSPYSTNIRFLAPRRWGAGDRGLMSDNLLLIHGFQTFYEEHASLYSFYIYI